MSRPERNCERIAERNCDTLAAHYRGLTGWWRPDMIRLLSALTRNRSVSTTLPSATTCDQPSSWPRASPLSPAGWPGGRIQREGQPDGAATRRREPKHHGSCNGATRVTVMPMAEPYETPPADGDREAAVARLTEHVGSGHLTLAEFDARARQTYSATSTGELVAVTADLSAPTAPAPPRRRARRWVVALLGGSTVTGRWRLSGTLTSISLMGGTTLDLRDVELDGAEVTITTIALLGGDDIYVPDGVDVEMTGFALMGGNDEYGVTTEVRPGAPRVRIRAFAVMGGVDLWRVPAGSSTRSLRQVRKRIKHHWH
ncbi:MAG: DUF1707 domain-containing protein [Pseudonocardiaceae bacterium]|nr:DUF1707 domain-containing protein [Pseudonocardiaceae bacterium]